MSLDYKLHKATEKKIDELVDSKIDISRREKNLIEKIETLKKDIKKLQDEKKEWESQKKREARRISEKEKNIGEVDKQSEKLLETITEEKNSLLKEKLELQKQLRKSEKLNKITKANLRRVRNREKILTEKLVEFGVKEKEIDRKLKVTKDFQLQAEELRNNANFAFKDSQKLFKKAERKNKEANALKIKLGIKSKYLDDKAKQVEKDRSWVGQRRAELELASREIRLKRRLLEKAYSKKDLDELDKKVIRKIGW